MQYDKFSRPIFTESDIFKLIYQGDIDKIKDIMVEKSEATSNLPQVNFAEEPNISINEFDKIQQQSWFMPDEYKNLDIEQYILNLSAPWDPEHTRTIKELSEFKARNMLDLLKWLKYFVDTARENKIVWGVGRGSSVSSYVLYLLGVHKIDSIKHNLDYNDFLR
jgi:DNA polymerase III alpha subunit